MICGDLSGRDGSLADTVGVREHPGRQPMISRILALCERALVAMRARPSGTWLKPLATGTHVDKKAADQGRR